MAVTQAEVLELFDQVSAIRVTPNVVDSDQFLIIAAKSDGTVSAAKITAELVRAYLNKGFEITIGADGYIYIGGEKSETKATAMMKIAQTDTIVTIDPNVLNVWGTVSSLDISFNRGSSGRAEEFMLEFTVGTDNFTLRLPSGVRWSTDPEWVNGNTYQVSVEDDLALFAEWEAANT